MLTPQERRGLMVIIGLLVLGTAYDAWRAHRPRWAPAPAAVTPAGAADAKRPERGASDRSAETTAPEGPEGVASGAPRVPASRPVDPSLAPASIDLNVADARTLERLPGVGPVLAGRIVAHRREHGPFEAVEDLRAVRGIGPRLLERLRPWVRVSPRPSAR